jgi:hypothetical protein
MQTGLPRKFFAARPPWTGFMPGMLILLTLLLFTGPGHAETVTDHAGRRVEIPQNPGRIVSLAPSITEIVFSLGCQQRLVGVTEYSDYPEGARSVCGQSEGRGFGHGLHIRYGQNPGRTGAGPGGGI